MQRVIAFGDIHGHDLTFATLLARICPTTEDLLVFVGDYIDRGPNSFGVVQRIIELRKQGIQCICLMGNHESSLLDLLGIGKMFPPEVIDGGADLLIFPSNGFAETAKSYSWPFSRMVTLDLLRPGCILPDEHREFYFGLQLSFTIGALTFVHAHLDRTALQETTAALAIQSQLDRDPMILLRERDTAYAPKAFPGLLVHGHNPVHRVFIPGSGHQTRPKGEVLIVEERLNLDTGIAGHHYMSAAHVSLKGELLEVFQEKDWDC